jgi:hypothetical protein
MPSDLNAKIEGYNILAYTYIEKSNLRLLKSLGSQFQVDNTPALIDTVNRHPGGGVRFSFFPYFLRRKYIQEIPALAYASLVCQYPGNIG